MSEATYRFRSMSVTYGQGATTMSTRFPIFTIAMVAVTPRGNTVTATRKVRAATANAAVAVAIDAFRSLDLPAGAKVRSALVTN